MQIFLPSPSFSESAYFLDNDRLRKQQIETEQILKTIMGYSEGWKNHPAVKQFINNEFLLCQYGMQISQECSKRGFESHYNYFKEFSEHFSDNGKPWWIGDERLHSSHRSRLLFKGKVDASTYSLRKFLRVRSINEWLKNNGYPPKNRFQLQDALNIERICVENNVKIMDNWYKQWNWKEKDDNSIPYFWPSKELNK